MAWTDILDSVLTSPKAFSQAVIRQFRDNDQYLKKRMGIYLFSDTSDILITAVTPAGILWAASQQIDIPTTGLIILVPTFRIDNASGSNKQYSVGARINGTDYFPRADENGTTRYAKTPTIATAQYMVSMGGLDAGAVAAALGSPAMDIEAFGISTGVQTVQPVIATSAAGSTQTLKGATFTSRLMIVTLNGA